MVTVIEIYKKAILWKPQAFAAPRILIFITMFMGMLLLALVAAGCISSDALNYSFYLMEMQYRSPNNYTIPPTSCPRAACGIDLFNKIPTCTSLDIRISYFGICLSDNITPVHCSTDIWNFASNAQGVDPLMAAEFAKALVEEVAPPYLLILSITFGLTAFILTMVLFLPLVFSWRHARNLHFLCIVMAGATSFFLFMNVVTTKLGVLGGLTAVPIISLQVISATRGVLTEAFLWTAWVLWFIAFWFVWLVRWWEILERREKKAAKAKKEKEAAEKKKKEEGGKAKKEQPIKADEALLQEMAAAQM